MIPVKYTPTKQPYQTPGGPSPTGKIPGSATRYRRSPYDLDRIEHAVANQLQPHADWRDAQIKLLEAQLSGIKTGRGRQTPLPNTPEPAKDSSLSTYRVLYNDTGDKISKNGNNKMKSSKSIQMLTPTPRADQSALNLSKTNSATSHFNSSIALLGNSQDLTTDAKLSRRWKLRMRRERRRQMRGRKTANVRERILGDDELKKEIVPEKIQAKVKRFRTRRRRRRRERRNSKKIYNTAIGGPATRTLSGIDKTAVSISAQNIGVASV